MPSTDRVDDNDGFMGDVIQIDHDFMDQNMDQALLDPGIGGVVAFQTAGRSCASCIKAS